MHRMTSLLALGLFLGLAPTGVYAQTQTDQPATPQVQTQEPAAQPDTQMKTEEPAQTDTQAQTPPADTGTQAQTPPADTGTQAETPPADTGTQQAEEPAVKTDTEQQAGQMPAQEAVITSQDDGTWLGSELMGATVYSPNDETIGDISDLIIAEDGMVKGVVIGVGGFLGIGQKDVAIPFDQIQWMSNQEVQASSNRNQGGESGTNTAGGVTVPSTATGGASQPATTGSTAAGGTGGMTGGTAPAGSTAGGGATAGSGSDPNTPARAMVKMTKADLQNAPEFRYSNDANRGNAGANNTNPPANANRPATAPQ